MELDTLPDLQQREFEEYILRSQALGLVYSNDQMLREWSAFRAGWHAAMSTSGSNEVKPQDDLKDE